MPAHPCINHIERCPAVIAAGGDTAERIRLEVERAEAERLKQAVLAQAGSSETLPCLIERSRATKSSLAVLVAAPSGARDASQLSRAGCALPVPGNSRPEEVGDGVSSRDQ